jgi:hypothetical protein
MSDDDMTGWRMLVAGEVIQLGDEYQVEMLGDKFWVRVWGAGDVTHKNSTAVRRKIEGLR